MQSHMDPTISWLKIFLVSDGLIAVIFIIIMIKL